MDLLLIRDLFIEDGIFGKLTDKDGKFIAVTAEHPFTTSSGFIPAMPVGIYTCQRGMHRLEHMSRDFPTYEVQNVPGHTGILFHVGNWPRRDSLGCILLGKETAPSQYGLMVTDSRKTFAEFMTLQGKEETFELTVIDGI